MGVDEAVPVLGFTYAGSYGHVDIAFTRWARGRGCCTATTPTVGSPRSRSAVPTRRRSTPPRRRSTPLGDGDGHRGGVVRQVAGLLRGDATMSMIRWFLLAISALIVGAFFIVWTLQRDPAIALLEALGATGLYVVRDAVAARRRAPPRHRGRRPASLSPWAGWSDRPRCPSGWAAPRSARSRCSCSSGSSAAWPACAA